jgi:hypothetical protein
MKQRVLEPELLDLLPPDDPGAVQSRADLLKVNWIMGNHSWMLRMLKQERKPGDRVCELGAGDGALSRKIILQGLCDPQDIHAVDLAPQPENWPAGASWHRSDLFATPLPECEIFIANLFLHHFTAEQLVELGKRIPASTRLILASEPARQRVHQITGFLVSHLLRLHFVTRFDMQVSIRAGFCLDELPRSLALQAPWSWRCWSTIFGANRVVMRRGI